jgi:polyhydroxybutyrate depolymerase
MPRLAFACPSGSAVELFRVSGGGHTWPGSRTSSELSFLGYTAMDVSATALMWRFFPTHPQGY